MSELSCAAIDRAYSYQVALPDDLRSMHNLTLIQEFCQVHGLEYVTAIWSLIKQEEFRLHCFTDLASARVFRNHFGGVMFDPKQDRQNGRAMGAWHRQDEHRRILESGPLSVPELLRN